MKQHNKAAVYLITANDLLTGDAIFYGGETGWSGDIKDAALFEEMSVAETIALQLNQQQAGQIVGAYPIMANRAKTPLKNREILRTTGPTNYWHGKQEGQRQVRHV